MESSYQVLGIPETASLEDIKKAYRDLVKRCHPDKDSSPGAEERFKKITRAYKVLLELSRCPTTEKDNKLRKGTDITVSLSVSSEDLVGCTSKTFAIKREGICPSCLGTGSEKRISIPCKYCNNTGYQGLLLILGQKKPCLYCSGTLRIPKEPKCKNCAGEGLVQETITHTVNLTPYSEVIVLKGEGNCCVGGYPGSLIVEIDVKRHSRYTLRGLDVLVNINISPAQAVLGDTLILPVYGRKVDFKIPPGCETGRVIERRGGGIIFRDRMGTLRAKVYILVPKIVTQEEEVLYKKLLELEKNPIWPPKTLMP